MAGGRGSSETATALLGHSKDSKTIFSQPYTPACSVLSCWIFARAEFRKKTYASALYPQLEILISMDFPFIKQEKFPEWEKCVILSTACSPVALLRHRRAPLSSGKHRLETNVEQKMISDKK